MPLTFHKYEGLGNDFVIVEAEHESAVSTDFAKKLCDRHFGIGGDGVLLLLPPVTKGAERRMRVINSDGSIPEMCGNGLRCAVLHVARERQLDRGEVTFDTDAGLRPCVVDDRDRQGFVTVDMGIVKVLGERMINVGPEGTWRFVLADAGNPHAITTQHRTRKDALHIGPSVNRHREIFPAGTNVEFAVFEGKEIELVVWERGAGLTMACGTGACATVAVGVADGLVAVNEEIKVMLPGGDLFITIKDDGRAIMRGPARHVFSGEVAL